MIRRYLVALSRQVERDSMQHALRMAKPDPGARILDCGCADGAWTRKTAAAIGTDDMWGIELSEAAAKAAACGGVNVVRAELNRPLPFADETFDVVLVYRILTNLWNTDEFLREVYRLMRADGYALIVNSNLASLHNAAYLIAGLQPPGAPTSNDDAQLGTWAPERVRTDSPFAVRALTLTGMKALLRHHGFRVDAVGGAGYYPLPGPLARLAARIDKRHAGWVTLRVVKTAAPSGSRVS